MLYKAIESGKEHRKHYQRQQGFDRTCRNHGACGYCYSNRTHRQHKINLTTKEEIKSFLDNE